MDCGWLESQAVIGSVPVRLRVVVLRARPDAKDPMPVVYIPGGPGDPARLDGAGIARWRDWQQRAGWPHDVVLFDPRGTGQSQPRISCRRRVGPDADSNGVPLRTAGDEFAGDVLRMAQCYRRLGATRAAALGPAAQIADLSRLIDALKVSGVHLWSVSYGSRIAQLYARRHPSRVRSLVLDSMFPFGRDALEVLPAQFGAALDGLDAWCDAHSTECAAAPGRPSEQVAKLLARYEEQPALLWDIGRMGRVAIRPITPYRLLSMVLLAGYTPGTRAETIRRLVRAGQGHTAALGPLWQRMHARVVDTAHSDAVFWSTRCAFTRSRDGSRRHWRAALQTYRELKPYLAAAGTISVCDLWRMPDVGSGAGHGRLPAPTLVVSGLADPATPPEWARSFAAAHARARWLAVADGGHGVTLTDGCVQGAVAVFLDAPAAVLPACDGSSGNDHNGR
ncbi:alpha/beta fold family hydrolase [Salinisphaera sp. T31B1]